MFFMFRVIPVWRHAFYILYAKSAEGINGGSRRYRLVAFPTRHLWSRQFPSIAGQCGKLIPQTAGFWKAGINEENINARF